MITHTITSDPKSKQNKTKSKLQIKKIAKNSNFARNFTRDTPSEVAWLDAQIWNGSNQNCWRYGGDTGCGTDGQRDGRTDRRTDGVKPIYPSTTSLCGCTKTIGHLLDATWSFVHYFKAMGELKLELQSGNAQFGSKLAIFCLVWPWNLTDDLEK